MLNLEQTFRTLAIKWEVKILLKKSSCILSLRLCPCVFFIIVSLWCCRWLYNNQRCASVQIMLSTDPSYDNRTIASTLKMHIQTVQRLRALLNGSDYPSDVYGIWCGFKWRPHHASSHLRSRLESQHQSVPGCAEECGDPLVQSGGRWQTLGVATGLDAGPKVQRDPGLASERVLRLCTLLSLAPSFPDLNPLDYFIWPYVENITNMTSHNIKAGLIAEYLPSSHRRLWKRHAPSSRSVSRRWLRLKTATLNKCQLYCIIKLPELIFSIKVLK